MMGTYAWAYHRFDTTYGHMAIWSRSLYLLFKRATVFGPLRCAETFLRGAARRIPLRISDKLGMMVRTCVAIVAAPSWSPRVSGRRDKAQLTPGDLVDGPPPIHASISPRTGPNSTSLSMYDVDMLHLRVKSHSVTLFMEELEEEHTALAKRFILGFLGSSRPL